MQVNITSLVTKDDQLAIFKDMKEHDGKPAFLMHVAENLGNITDIDIVGIYRVASGVPYGHAVVVILEVQDGKSLVAVIKRHGVAFAKVMETRAKVLE